MREFDYPPPVIPDRPAQRWCPVCRKTIIGLFDKMCVECEEALQSEDK